MGPLRAFNLSHMETGYLQLIWNHIPGLFTQKDYIHTLVIPLEDLHHICDPENLKRYWEPTQDPANFQTTIALAFCHGPFDDCYDLACKGDTLVLVAVVRKPSCFPALTFVDAAIKLLEISEETPTLLVVCLHCEWSQMDTILDKVQYST